jgi:hypothetical protein
MPDHIAATPIIADAESLRRLLATPGSFLEHDGTRWLIAGRPKPRQADNAVVAALERSGQLMRLPDGSLRLAAPAGRLQLTKTTMTNDAGERIAVTIDTAESPLGWMLHRRARNGAPEFDTALIAAAERLRLDYTRAHLEPRVTMSLDSFIASGARGRSGTSGPDTSLSALAAKQRFFAALDAVGPELSNILAEICCLTAGLEQAERNLGLPVRSGKAVLHLALTRLARHYGFLAPERAGERHRAVRDWRLATVRKTERAG